MLSTPVDYSFGAVTLADDAKEVVTIGDVSKRTSRPQHPELVPTRYCEFPALSDDESRLNSFDCSHHVVQKCLIS